MKVSVGVLARNNEAEIAACLESVAWADERIVILDTRSTDRTAKIAESMGARVVVHRFEDFARQREFGLTQASNEWLFYVDSDERASRALGQEIRRVIGQGVFSGWWVPRSNVIWGQEIRHGGWYPDYQLRLLCAIDTHYDMERPVHEIPLIAGEAGYLQEPLIHYNYATVRQFVRKQRQYIDYEAQILYDRGTRPHVWTYVTQPIREFWRRYVRLKGYRDGLHGLLLCALVAYYYGFRVTVRLAQKLASD